MGTFQTTDASSSPETAPKSGRSRRSRGTQPEWLSHGIFLLCAIVVILSMVALFVFVGTNSLLTFTKFHVTPLEFFFGTNYNPDEGHFGAFIPILGSFSVTAVAVLLAAPVSVGVAVFVTQIAPHWARQVMQPVLELFVGIPSVVYGLLGLQLLVPLVARIYNTIAGIQLTAGFGLIAAGLVLAIMILPTITTISIDAIAALPPGLREASLALGATRWQTVRKTLLPASSTGIFTGIVLGMGRAIGETLAVAYVIGGNAGRFPFGFSSQFPYISMSSTTTITVQVLFDAKEFVPGQGSYAGGWTLAFILLVLSLVFVLISRAIAARSVFKQSPGGGRHSDRPVSTTTSVVSRGGL